MDTPLDILLMHDEDGDAEWWITSIVVPRDERISADEMTAFRAQAGVKLAPIRRIADPDLDAVWRRLHRSIDKMQGARTPLVLELLFASLAAGANARLAVTQQPHAPYVGLALQFEWQMQGQPLVVLGVHAYGLMETVLRTVKEKKLLQLGQVTACGIPAEVVGFGWNAMVYRERVSEQQKEPSS